MIEVGRLDAFREAMPTVVEAGGRQIVIVRWRDAVFALRNICPHMSKSFELGSVFGRPGGTVADPFFDSRDPVITCPWHQFEYSLHTGSCLTDDTLRVRTYPTEVQDGKVFVNVARTRAAA